MLPAVGKRASFAPLAMRGVRGVDGPKASPIFSWDLSAAIKALSNIGGQGPSMGAVPPSVRSNYGWALPRDR